MLKVPRQLLTVFAAIAIGLGAATLSTSAASAATTTCVRTDDVCRVSTYTGGGKVFFATYFSNVSSGSAYWEIRRNGVRICYGSMGYRDTGNCTVSGSGTVTFGFWKGQNAEGNISLTSN